MPSPRSHTRRRARSVGAGVAIAAAFAIVAVAMWTPSDHRVGPPPASGEPSDEPTAVGPVVYYEVLDADGSHLMERRLDGRSLARTVATRTDVDYGRTWIVDPTGMLAVAAVPGTDHQVLEAISVATGASVWSTRTALAPVDHAVWSADGGRFALATLGAEFGPREVVVIESATGRFVKTAIPDDALLQGFDRTGALILRQDDPAPKGVAVAWRFLRVDPATASISRLAALPDVGPASDAAADVDPAVGFAVDASVGANGEGTAIRLWPLHGGAPRTLATVPSIDRIAIDPGGTGVAMSAAQSIRFIAFDGRASELFSGPDPIADFTWSAGGDYLGVATDRRGPNLTILERATGRAVEVPHSDEVAQLLLVRIVGDVPFPAAPLPAVEPSPSPTAAPSGRDVAGFAGLDSGWVERRGDVQVARVQRLVPTEGGGLRVAADMPPLELGPVTVPDDGGPELQLLRRPGNDELLVWIGAAGRSRGWLWDGGSGLRQLDLPPDWPDHAYDIAWRPDGLAVAASAGRASADGEFEGIFAVAVLGTATTSVVPIVGDYDRLEGWWSTSELRVGHGICSDGCKGRYAEVARLGVADHRLTPLTPADRLHGSIDEVTVDPIAGTILLSLINDDPADDIVIDWPGGLGPIYELDVIGFAADGRSLLLTQGTADGTDLYRIDDPAGRAVKGRLADPSPTRLSRLDHRGVRVDVSPDDAWATVIDRVDNVRLVRLSDGRSWPVDRGRTLVWAGRG